MMRAIALILILRDRTPSSPDTVTLLTSMNFSGDRAFMWSTQCTFALVSAVDTVSSEPFLVTMVVPKASCSPFEIRTSTVHSCIPAFHGSLAERLAKQMPKVQSMRSTLGCQASDSAHCPFLRCSHTISILLFFHVFHFFFIFSIFHVFFFFPFFIVSFLHFFIFLDKRDEKYETHQMWRRSSTQWCPCCVPECHALLTQLDRSVVSSV